MSSDDSVDVREVVFVNQAAFEAYVGLPDEVRQGRCRHNGDSEPSAASTRQAEIAVGDLAGIDEVRIGFEGDAYRVYHLVQYDTVVYVLDAGMKKSPRGGEIPQQDVKRLVARKKQAQKDYEANKPAYQAAYNRRASRRTVLEHARKNEPS
jgi:phage-related protein